MTITMLVIWLLRPTARTAAVSPMVRVASVAADREGRLNGAASPAVTGRGNGSLPASRCAASPCPARGAWPAVIAWTAESRPARTAGTRAASPVSPSIPAGTVMVIQRGTATVTLKSDRTWIRGSAHRLPSAVPASAPASAGIPSWVRYVAAT
jgi:hypothetical protein